MFFVLSCKLGGCFDVLMFDELSALAQWSKDPEEGKRRQKEQEGRSELQEEVLR